MDFDIFYNWNRKKVIYNVCFVLLTFFVLQYLIDTTFAIGYILLVILHELGHISAALGFGLHVSFGGFRPFGAYIRILENSSNQQNAIIALAGPFCGCIGGTFCIIIFLLTKVNSFLCLGYFTLLISLVNLLPIHPFDGGKVSSAINPKLSYIIFPFIFFSIYYAWKIDPIFYAISFVLLYYSITHIIIVSKEKSKSLIDHLDEISGIRKKITKYYIALILYLLGSLIYLFYQFDSLVFFHFNL